MTSPDSRPAVGAAQPDPIENREYLAALDKARELYPWTDPTVYQQLRKDITGRGLSGQKALAVLRSHLKITPSSAIQVFFSTLQAADLALNKTTTEAWCLERAAAYQDDADLVQKLLARHDIMAWRQRKFSQSEQQTEVAEAEALGLPVGSCNALKVVHRQLLDQAAFYRNEPKRLQMTQKNKSAYLFLRSMREKLFSDRRPNHKVLKVLAEVALCITVTDDEVKGALRQRGTGGNSRNEIGP